MRDLRGPDPCVIGLGVCTVWHHGIDTPICVHTVSRLLTRLSGTVPGLSNPETRQREVGLPETKHISGLQYLISMCAPWESKSVLLSGICGTFRNMLNYQTNLVLHKGQLQSHIRIFKGKNLCKTVKEGSARDSS